MINERKSPIQDNEIEDFFSKKKLNLIATLDAKKAYQDAEFIVIAAPTNYDSKKNFFDTSAVENVIELVLDVNPDAMMVIKSTIPVGYTESIRKKYNTKNNVRTSMSDYRKEDWLINIPLYSIGNIESIVEKD